MPPEIIKALGPITKEGHSYDECISALETTMKYSVNTLNPFFFDKLYAGSDPIGQIAELIVTVLNTGTHVYNCSPVFSVMEDEVQQILAKQFGFPVETSEGVSNPGGTMSNMMAVILARQETFPHVRTEGWKPEDRPIAYTSRQSHYSVARGAMVCGMGMNNMRDVPCERWTGAMSHEALEEMIVKDIEQGNKPFFVNSVASTTVMGSFDDHHAINAICRKYGLWHHVDACWGGFLAFSEKNRHLFDGSEKADSLSVNPHKGMGVPQQSSYILTNNKQGLLHAANNSGAEYLFQHGEYSKYDIGDKTLQCGRKPDGLKTWMTLKKHGIDGMAAIADAAVEKSKYIQEKILAQPDKFEMINKPMAVNVCFSYTPPAYRNREYTYAARCRVHKQIYETMNNDGTIVI